MKELFEHAAGRPLPSPHDLHLILDAVPVAVSWATLPDGVIQFTNRTFRRLFGYPDGHFETVDQWIDKTYPADTERRDARERWQALWHTQSTGLAEIEPVEVRVRCASGSCRTTLHRGILLFDMGVGIATFEDISARKQAEDDMRRIALQDPLTELANRRALYERWQSEAAADPGPRMMALILIDLDEFKPVNDRLGHEAGDEVLKIVAARLRHAVRSDSDMVVRLGGDEFAVLLPRLAHPGQVDAVCHRIAQAFQRPIHCRGQAVSLGASVGVSLYPLHGRDLKSLLRQADEALYRRKSAGKGGWEWFAAPPAPPP